MRSKRLCPTCPETPRVTQKLDASMRAKLCAAMPGLKERAKTLIELLDGAKFLFAERPLVLDAKAASILDAGGRAHIARMIPRLAALADWNAASTRSGRARLCGGNQNQARRRRAAAARRAHRAGGVARNFRCSGSAWPGRKPRPPARPDRVRSASWGESLLRSISPKRACFSCLPHRNGGNVGSAEARVRFAPQSRR